MQPFIKQASGAVSWEEINGIRTEKEKLHPTLEEYTDPGVPCVCGKEVKT